MDWLEQCQFFSFFFSRLENSRWFVFQRVFFVRRRFSSSHSRISLVETSTTTSGAFKREFAVADHARVISRSFVRHSRSFLLRFIYVHWNVFSRLKPDIIKIHIFMKNRIVRFYRSRFRIFFNKCFYMAWKFLFEKFLCGQYEPPLSCSPSLPR